MKSIMNENNFDLNKNIVTVNVKPVGDKCNIHCKYCDVVGSENVGLIHIPTYEACLKILKEKHEFVHFVLHGGEPLLLDRNGLAQIIQKTRDIFQNNCDFQIQTNGILLEKDVINFLKETECRVSISFDPAFGNLRYDRKAYLQVKRNIEEAVSQGCNPGILSVAHSLNVSAFIPFIEDLLAIGVQNWTINKVRGNYSSRYFLSEEKYLFLLSRILEEWIVKEYYKRISIQPLIDLLLPGKNHSCHFCSVEEKCSFFYSYFHKTLISGCEHFDLRKGSRERCQNCNVFDFCGGGCSTDFISEDFCRSRKKFYSLIKYLKLRLWGFL